MSVMVSSLDFRKVARSHLFLAFVVSIIAHLVLFGAYRSFKHMHWDGQQKLLSWLIPKPSSHHLPLLNVYKAILPKKPELKPQAVQPQRETPTIFISVDPSQAVPVAPKEAKYYSDKNSLASNQRIVKESKDPNLDGKQKHVPQTMDIPRQTSKPEPLQPAQQKPPEPQKPQLVKADKPQPKVEELKPQPKGGETSGNLALAKPSEVKEKSAGQSETKQGQDQASKPARPKSLAEARAAAKGVMPPSQKMAQEGGVRRSNLASSLDAKASPFGNYDAMVIEAIRQRWYDLLDTCTFSRDRVGYVVVDFRLYSDGSARLIKESDNSVGPVWGGICQNAISSVSPFKAWPEEMLQMVGRNYREVRFTFYYE